MAEPMWEKIGKVPTLGTALRMVLETGTRYGRRVYTHSITQEQRRSEESKKRVREQLERIQAEISNRETASKQSEKSIRLNRQREILTALTEIGERKVQAIELAAAMVLVHGLDGDELRNTMNAALRLSRTSEAPFEGSMGNMLGAIRQNVLRRAYNALDKPKRSDGTPIEGEYYASARDLRIKLRSNAANVSTAMGILDVMGGVHKLPFDSQTNSLVWMHKRHTPPEPSWNHGYNIFSEIVDQWVRHGRPVSIGHFAGGMNRPGSYHSQLVRDVFRNHEENELIHEYGKVRGRVAFRPDEDAIRWLEETRQTGHLHPQLYMRLMGEYRPRPKFDPRRIEQILKEIRLKMRIGQQSVKSIAKELGIGKSRAHAYATNQSTSMKGMKPETLAELAGHLKDLGHEKEAGFLLKTLSKRKDN